MDGAEAEREAARDGGGARGGARGGEQLLQQRAAARGVAAHAALAVGAAAARLAVGGRALWRRHLARGAALQPDHDRRERDRLPLWVRERHRAHAAPQRAQRQHGDADERVVPRGGVLARGARQQRLRRGARGAVAVHHPDDALLATPLRVDADAQRRQLRLRRQDVRRLARAVLAAPRRAEAVAVHGRRAPRRAGALEQRRLLVGEAMAAKVIVEHAAVRRRRRRHRRRHHAATATAAAAAAAASGRAAVRSTTRHVARGQLVRGAAEAVADDLERHVEVGRLAERRELRDRVEPGHRAQPRRRRLLRPPLADARHVARR